MKVLSIIIPYHNEDLYLLNYPLSSLNTQIGVDWNDIEIIISNNCETPKEIDSWLRQFTYIYPSIRYVECPVKSGMGQNRQFGISVSTGKYLMFSDSDDTLLSPIALKTMMDEIYTDKYNLISGKVVREVVERGSPPVICDMQSGTLLMHGKAYRKDFITKKGIHFSPHIFAYEDFFFNLLATTYVGAENTGLKTLSEGIYTWKAREDSVSSEMGTQNYTSLYYKDSILYVYYAAKHLEDYPVSDDVFHGFVKNCLFNIYHQRMASPLNDELTLAVASLVLKCWKRDLTELTQEFSNNNAKVTTLETLSEWMKRVIAYDSTDAETKFDIKPHKKFIYQGVQ